MIHKSRGIMVGKDAIGCHFITHSRRINDGIIPSYHSYREWKKTLSNKHKPHE